MNFCQDLIFVLFILPILATGNMDAKSVNNFSYKFFNELQQDRSVVSSPLSAEILLALIALGSTDEAHSELLKALSLSDDKAIRTTFGGFTTKFKSVKGVTLDVANKIYLKEGNYELDAQLNDDATNVFDAGLEKIDFAKSSAAAKTINSWVESKTNNRIKDLITSDSLDDTTRLVLVNALYFKGTWKKQFDKKTTRVMPFFVTVSRTIEIPMMTKTDDFKYGQSKALNSQLLEMPYVGDGASMLIVLPNEIEGLKQVVKTLAEGHDLSSDIAAMHSTKVDVIIPKFKIETEIDLKELLPKIGINKIFDKQNSGLTRILNNAESLFVSKAIQKAFIEVNEEGAEAAAATAMVIHLYCGIPDEPNPLLWADHPFLVLILVQGVPAFIAAHWA